MFCSTCFCADASLKCVYTDKALHSLFLSDYTISGKVDLKKTIIMDVVFFPVKFTHLVIRAFSFCTSI